MFGVTNACVLGTSVAQSSEVIEADGRDWRELFYVSAFLDFSLIEREILRPKLVWIRRFVAHSKKPQLYSRMQEIIAAGHCDPVDLERLTVRAARELSIGEKRRFVYNLAQLCQSKGPLSDAEYGKILDVAQRIGISDVDADAILRSVYNLNNTLIVIIGVLAAGAILYFAQAVIVPLVIAVFITMMVHKLQRVLSWSSTLQRFPWLGKLAALVIILASLFGLVMAAVVSGNDVARRFPEYEEQLKTVLQHSTALQSALGWLGARGVTLDAQSLPLGNLATSFVGSLFVLVGNFVLIAVFTGFLVFSTSRFTGVLAEVSDRIGTYATVHTLMCLLTGVGAFVLCKTFGVDFALFWGLLAFLLNYIPSVGSVIATVPPMVLAVVQLDSWTAIVVFIVLLEALQILVGQVLEPKLLGDRLGLNPIAILLGLIFWGLLWGIPGMLLATPLMVLLRIVASYFNVSRGFERLLTA